MNWSLKGKRASEWSFFAYTIALALLVLGAARSMGIDAILAVFVAGVAYRMVKVKEKQQEEQKSQEAISKFFVFPFFALFGALAPWEEWWELGWKGVAVAALILLLRRLPWMLLLSPLVPELKASKDVWFVGWFGPIGVSTVLYAALAFQKTGHSEGWVVGSLVIFASLLAHGLSSTPLSRRYGRSQGIARS
jgi:NhaP-type Na+/H+ or K+/H+ antiporter